MHCPPALMMRARAVSVKRSAHTFNAGTSWRRTSSVTVPTIAATLPSLPFMNLATLDKDNGGRFVFDMNKRLSTVSLNLESVRRAKNR